MTVGELKDLLETYDDNDEVVMKPENSNYVDGIDHATEEYIRSFWGKDRKTIVLKSSGQTGAL